MATERTFSSADRIALQRTIRRVGAVLVFTVAWSGGLVAGPPSGDVLFWLGLGALGYLILDMVGLTRAARQELLNGEQPRSETGQSN